jgi:Uroporphyrinogen-III synthase
MPGNKIRILSTRPIDDDLIREANDDGILIDQIPFITTEINNDKTVHERIRSLVNEEITAVFTSMTSVEAVGHYTTGKSSWHIYCIGHATRRLVESNFSGENISGTAVNAEQLATKIIEQSPKKVIFFCGDKRLDELPTKLKKAGIEVEELVVYKTTGTPQTLSQPYDGILFFSPSAVNSFFSKNSITGKTTIFAIGNTTAEAVMAHTANQIIISELPGKNNLVQLMIQHFKKVKNF